MSQSPATPNKHSEEASKQSSKVAVPSFEKIVSVTRAKHAPLYEPSPASTYGDTAAGDSVPATPLETHAHDSTAALIRSLRDANIGDSDEISSGSPVQVHGGKHRAQSEGRVDVINAGILVEMYASPPKTGSMGTTSPKTSRLRQIAESPSWRHGEAFVRKSKDQDDDPFIIGANSVQTQGNTLVVPVNPIAPATSAAPAASFQPRDDRIGLELSPDTAQAILPPNACVFVANLSQTRSDEQLEYSVTTVFQAFGNVYVKIRRDGKGMPFAFCQYENVADAQRAITMGRGMSIDGRACRTEVAKVNRSLYLSKVTGGFVSEAEARQTLARFGALEKVWYCSQTDKEMFRLPEGIWVMFAFFQDCRDAQIGFRDDHSYRLEQPRMPDDIRARLGNRPFQSPMSPLHRPSHAHTFVSPQSALRRAQDLCSIFVGNLPADVDEQSLRNTFSVNGHVHKVEIVRKASVNTTGVNNFAFIEFFSQDEAIRAAGGVYVLSGVHLRVERKETIEPHPRRNLTIMTGGSPQNRYLADNEAMALMFQRGLSIGMANAATSPVQPVPPPAFAPYPYYQPVNSPSAYNPYADPALAMTNDASATLQVPGNTYLPQAMGNPLQYPQAVSPYTVGPFPARQNTYQWPPANPNGEMMSGSSGAVGEDSR